MFVFTFKKIYNLKTLILSYKEKQELCSGKHLEYLLKCIFSCFLEIYNAFNAIYYIFYEYLKIFTTTLCIM